MNYLYSELWNQSIGSYRYKFPESFENNYSLSFDGVDDYVAVDNFKLNQPQTLTIGLSIKIDRIEGYLDAHTNILENDRSGGQFALGMIKMNKPIFQGEGWIQLV